MSELGRVINNKLALVIGIGNSACKALNDIHLSNKADEIDFLAIDTDEHALAQLDIPASQQLIIGEKMKMGLSIEDKPELGRNSAIESIPKINKIISKDYAIVFLLAGMDGGTGTGALPIIAELCHNLDCIIISIVSIPHFLEDEIKKTNMQNGIDFISQFSDIVLKFSIDGITNSHENQSPAHIFQCSDLIFKTPIDIILRMLSFKKYTIYPYPVIDLDDLKTVIQGANGLSAVISGIGKGENRIKEALLDMSDSPYLLDIKPESIKSILVFIESSIEYEITMSEIGRIVDYFQEEVGNDTVIIWGSSFNPELNAEIRINAILSPKLNLYPETRNN